MKGDWILGVSKYQYLLQKLMPYYVLLTPECGTGRLDLCFSKDLPSSVGITSGLAHPDLLNQNLLFYFILFF